MRTMETNMCFEYDCNKNSKWKTNLKNFSFTLFYCWDKVLEKPQLYILFQQENRKK